MRVSISRTSGYFVDRVVPLTVGVSVCKLSPFFRQNLLPCHRCLKSADLSLRMRLLGLAIKRGSSVPHCSLACLRVLRPPWPSGSRSGYCLKNTGGRIAVRVCILWHIVCQAPFHRLLWDMRSADVTASVAGWDFKRLSVSRSHSRSGD